MGKINKHIANMFNFKAKKQQAKQKQAIEQAKQISDNMIKGKQETRQIFMEKLLQKLQDFNEAREDWEDYSEAGADLDNEEQVQEVNEEIDKVLEKGGIK